MKRKTRHRKGTDSPWKSEAGREKSGRRVHAGLTLALLAGSMHAAFAQVSDVLNVKTQIDMKYDNNIFDLPPDANTAALLGKSRRSTFIYTEQADLLVDKTLSMQHFRLDLNALHQSLQDFHYLDFTTFNYTVDWNWHATSRLTGNIGASRKEQLGDYADFQSYSTRNLQTANERHFTFDFIGTTHWHVVGGVARYALDNPDQFTQVGTFAENSAQIGVKYVSTEGNQTTLQIRTAVGNFDRDPQQTALLDNHYVQRQVKLIADYRLAGHTTTQAWVGYANRRSGDFSARDFQGPIGSVSVLWAPTNKSNITFSYVHDLIDYEDDASSYYLTNVVRINPVWKATSKVSVSAEFELAYNSFRQPVQPVPQLRVDKVFNTALRLEYQPIKTVTLSVYGQWRKRVSNTDVFRYGGNVAGLTGSFIF